MAAAVTWVEEKAQQRLEKEVLVRNKWGLEGRGKGRWAGLRPVGRGQGEGRGQDKAALKLSRICHVHAPCLSLGARRF